MNRKPQPADGQLSHLDAAGRAQMVDISQKPRRARRAVASARVRMNQAAHDALCDASSKKGDVLAVARVAAIGAIKQTAHIVPLCHQVVISGCSVHFELEPSADGVVVSIEVEVGATDATGVEMEALTGASVAALTLYDMLKAVDRAMTIERIQLERKEGGSGGPFVRGETAASSSSG